MTKRLELRRLMRFGLLRSDRIFGIFGSAALDRGKQRDFVAVFEFVIAGLIIDADGCKQRFAHGPEFWKTAAQISQQFAQSLSGTDRLDQLGAASQLFKV